MYNNFLSKKSKKAISALLASALVITAAPISAEAATNKVVGVNKSTTVSVSASAKVTGLSKAEKKIVKITKKGKKFTIKGLKAGKATFKIGKKAFTVKVGTTSIKKKTFATSLTAGTNKAVSVTAAYGKGDALTWKSSNTAVVKVSKASVSVTKNTAATVVKNTLKPLKKGTATITITSKKTGKSLKVKVTVKAKATPATNAPASNAPASQVPASQVPQTSDNPSGPAVSGNPASQAPQTSDNPSGPAVSGNPASQTPASQAPVPTESTVPTQAPATVSAEAVSASAVNVKTIAVKFNRDLTKDEQNALVVDVTKENATQSVKSAFKTDDTLYITRDTDLAFTSGTYKVVLSGTVAYTQNVEVQAQKATSLTVTSVVLEDGKDKAAVKVSLKDQYGEEMDFTEADFTTKNYVNQTQSGTSASLAFDNANKTFYIDTLTNADAYKINDVVNVVLLHKSGLSATATLKVVEATYVNEIKLGDFVLPIGTTRLTEDVQNVDIPYTATNNYGEVVDLTAGDYSIVSTEASVLDSNTITLYKDSNNKTYFRIAAFAGAGKTTLIVMNNKNGQTAKIDLDVQEKAGKPYAIQLEKSSVEVAKGSTAYVALTVTDKYGDKVAAKDLAGENALVLASSNTSALDNAKLSIVTDEADANYGKLSIVATDATANSTVVVTVTLPNGTNTTLQVKIGNPAVPTTLQATAKETVLVAGATATITATVNDQYSGEVATLGDYSVEANVLDNNGVITVATTGSVKEFAVTGQKAGTARVKVDLKDKDGKIVDTKTVNFTVEANTTANLTYGTKEISTLYKNTNAATIDSAVTAGYAKEVVITGKKADGTTITLPANKILSITSDNDVVIAGQNGGKWYVAGKDTAPETIKADVTAKLTIVVGTDDGSTTINQNVTVSKDAAKIAAIKLYDKANNADDKKELTSVSVDNYGEAIAFNAENKSYLYAEDQFGVATMLDSADAVSLSSYNNIDGAGASTATYSADTLTMTNKVGTAKAGASYKVTLVKAGATITFTVNVKNADVTTPASTAPTTTSGSSTTTAPEPTPTADTSTTNAPASNAPATTAPEVPLSPTGVPSVASGSATVDVTVEFNKAVSASAVDANNIQVTGSAVSGSSATGSEAVTVNSQNVKVENDGDKKLKISLTPSKELYYKEGELEVSFKVDSSTTITVTVTVAKSNK